MWPNRHLGRYMCCSRPVIPLTAMVLAGRGLDSPEKAKKYLDCDGPLPDPFLMTDMAAAKARIALALERGEAMAVFGDYDVDGVTATCLLTDFLRKRGADCRTYIPGRMGEGYGLNPAAVRLLAGQGVTLIVTVDCGITAVEEAALCRELGVDLIVTDHHECKDRLPQAVAVVDPHRKGDGYPHRDLSGVGVAFKLAAALAGDQETVLREYADLVCLGTVADVMPFGGEPYVCDPGPGVPAADPPARFEKSHGPIRVHTGESERRFHRLCFGAPHQCRRADGGNRTGYGPVFHRRPPAGRGGGQPPVQPQQAAAGH
ncbi:MAG: DHH family phosphoesterase [Oscillospiraceae bacterium]